MKAVPVQEAVGMVLSHDITQIVPGKFKGPLYKKGHIIQEIDIPGLLDIGKENIYVFDLNEGFIHEDDAAVRIARAAAGKGIGLTPPSEGKVDLIATSTGLLKVDAEVLNKINTIEDVVFATLHTHQVVSGGSPVAGTRIIPLVTREGNILEVERLCRAHFPLIQIKTFTPLSVGIVTTGSEVYHGRIEDRFGPVLRSKFADLDCPVLDQVLVSDDIHMTASAIGRLIEDGAELIAVTGGMSVDPDDRTPAAIRAAGGKVITYGAPTFPGAMFMLAYIGNIPVVGLPGCVMYHRTSIFDLILPRIIAGETVSRTDITALGHGGFCLKCNNCSYPACGFGKAS